MDDFVLPDKWCIRGCPELGNYQRETLEGKSNCALNIDDCYYTNTTIDLNPKKWRYSRNFVPYGYIEITFEQFKKYVLNEPVEPSEPENYDYLIKLFKELNIN